MPKDLSFIAQIIELKAFSVFFSFFVLNVCLWQRRYYALLNTNKLWRTTALIYVEGGQYYKVSQRASDQGSFAKPHATGVPNS